SIDDINVSVRRHHDGADSAEIARAVAGHARLAKNHKNLAVWAELDQVGALAVLCDLIAGPDIAVAVDVKAVRDGELIRAESLLERARSRKLDNRCDGRVRAFLRSAPLEHPDALAVAMVDLHLDGLSEFAAVG